MGLLHSRYITPVMYIDPSGELGILLWLAVSGIMFCAATSAGGYVAASVMSIWDEEVREDMDDIGWNLFNSDDPVKIIEAYIKFFNEERPAYALDYLKPKQYKEMF